MLESHVLPEFSARFGADGNDELNAKRWRLVANWLHLKLLAVLNVIEREHGRTASGESGMRLRKREEARCMAPGRLREAFPNEKGRPEGRPWRWTVPSRQRQSA